MKSGILKTSIDMIIHFISGNTTHRKRIITGLNKWAEKQAVISLLHHTHMVKKKFKSRHKQILMEWHHAEAKAIYLFYDCCCCWHTSLRQKSSELKQKQIIKIYHTIRSKFDQFDQCFSMGSIRSYKNDTISIVDNICFWIITKKWEPSTRKKICK